MMFFNQWDPSTVTLPNGMFGTQMETLLNNKPH